MLQKQIKEELKDAMRAKEAVRLGVIKGLMSAFTNELVAKRRGPDGELTDDEVLDLIRRGVKQRKDAIDQFTKGGRPELAESEQAELVVLEKYLPTMMSQDEILPIVEAKMKERGVVAGDKSGAGKLTGALMKDLKGKADGGDVKAIVDKLLE